MKFHSITSTVIFVACSLTSSTHAKSLGRKQRNDHRRTRLRDIVFVDEQSYEQRQPEEELIHFSAEEDNNYWKQQFSQSMSLQTPTTPSPSASASATLLSDSPSDSPSHSSSGSPSYSSSDAPSHSSSGSPSHSSSDPPSYSPSSASSSESPTSVPTSEPTRGLSLEPTQNPTLNSPPPESTPLPTLQLDCIKNYDDLASAIESAADTTSSDPPTEIDICPGRINITTTFEVYNKKFIMNCRGENCELNGGDTQGILVTSNHYDIEFNGITFANGFSSGAVFLSDPFDNNEFLQVKATFNNCLFLRNSGWVQGGAMHVGSSELKIINCTFVENIAFQNLGGAMFLSYSEVTISGSTFLNNTAQFYGGAIFINDADEHPPVRLLNNTFVNNSAGKGAHSIGVNKVTSFDCTTDVNFYPNDWESGQVQDAVQPGFGDRYECGNYINPTSVTLSPTAAPTFFPTADLTPAECFSKCFDGDYCTVDVVENVDTCTCNAEHPPVDFNASLFEDCCSDSGFIIKKGTCCPIGSDVCCGLSLEECKEVIDPCSISDSADPCCSCPLNSFCFNDGICMDFSTLASLPDIPGEIDRTIESGGDLGEIVLVFGVASVTVYAPGEGILQIYVGTSDVRYVVADFRSNLAVEFRDLNNVQRVLTSFKGGAIFDEEKNHRRQEEDFLFSSDPCVEAVGLRNWCRNLAGLAGETTKEDQAVTAGAVTAGQFIAGTSSVGTLLLSFDLSTRLAANTIALEYCAFENQQRIEEVFECCPREFCYANTGNECCAQDNDCDEVCGCVAPDEKCCRLGQTIPKEECCPEELCNGNECCTSSLSKCTECGCLSALIICCEGEQFPLVEGCPCERGGIRCPSGEECCNRECVPIGECRSPSPAPTALCDGEEEDIGFDDYDKISIGSNIDYAGLTWTGRARIASEDEFGSTPRPPGLVVRSPPNFAELIIDRGYGAVGFKAQSTSTFSFIKGYFRSVSCFGLPVLIQIQGFNGGALVADINVTAEYITDLESVGYWDEIILPQPNFSRLTEVSVTLLECYGLDPDRINKPSVHMGFDDLTVCFDSTSSAPTSSISEAPTASPTSVSASPSVGTFSPTEEAPVSVVLTPSAEPSFSPSLK